MADILWKKGEDVTQEELESAQENYERQKTYRNADGSKPESVKRMEWLESTANKHDVTINLQKDYAYGNGAMADDKIGAKDPEKGSTTYVIIDLNSIGTSYEAEKNIKKDLGATFAHEVAGHAYNNAKGESLIGADKNDPDRMKKEEQSATYIENTHRAARHLRQRTTYSGLRKVKQVPKQSGPIITKPSQSDLSKRDEA
ncbi:hypothetical protein P4C99_07190 [Pontiellaceae bacterium B1224]|nr:hypothetical protein [Pontiellaceae bacterium B1224]